MDIEKLITDLISLESKNPEKFKQRMKELKENKPSVYKQVLKELSPEAYEKVKKQKEKGEPRLIYAIIGVVIVGLIFLGAVLFFLGELSLQSPDINASESLELGMNFFKTINDTYLQYSFARNISGVEVTYINGREYYKLDDGDYKFITYSETYNCTTPSECELVKGEDYDYNQKTEDTLYYDSKENCSVITEPVFNISSVMEYYNQLYHFLEQGYVTDSYRESIGTIKEIECAPMYFQVELPTKYLRQGEELTELRYEVCLDNEGVPLALGLLFNSNKRIVVFKSYLQSTSESLVKKTSIQGKEFQEWTSEDLSC